MTLSAYVILIREETKDKAELQEYARLSKLIGKREYEVQALYTKFEVVEGDPIEAVGILAFKTLKAAQEWYRNPEYQAAVAHRLKGGNYRTIIVEGGRGSR